MYERAEITIQEIDNIRREGEGVEKEIVASLVSFGTCRRLKIAFQRFRTLFKIVFLRTIAPSESCCSYFFSFSITHVYFRGEKVDKSTLIFRENRKTVMVFGIGNFLASLQYRMK